MTTPDIAGEIMAFRSWDVTDSLWTRAGARLLSLNGTLWPTSAWLEADCELNHEIPDEVCSCGIYAARTRGHLVSLAYNDGGGRNVVRAIGEVALVGKVIPGTQGWRASRARPVRLWVPYDQWRLANSLSQAYAIPVGLSDTLTVEG